MSSVLKGNVISVPLVIEDETTHKAIKRSALYVLSSLDDNDLTITSLMTEGTFQTKLSKEVRLNSRKVRNQLTNDDGQWETILNNLFCRYSVENDFVLVGKYVTNGKYYDEEGEYIEDEADEEVDQRKLILDIKSNLKIPITIGTIEVSKLGEDEMDGKDETNFLNWLDLLIENNKKVNELLSSTLVENKRLKSEKDYYHKEVINISSENDKILKDIEYKFYKVLNSKKDRIWELESKQTVDPLAGLNGKYIKENEFNVENKKLNMDQIPDELRSELITSTRKRKKQARKTEIESEEEEEVSAGEEADAEGNVAIETSKVDDEDEYEENIQDSPNGQKTAISDTDEEDETENNPHIKTEESLRIEPSPHNEKEYQHQHQHEHEFDSESPKNIEQLERDQKEKQHLKYKRRRFKKTKPAEPGQESLEEPLKSRRTALAGAGAGSASGGSGESMSWLLQSRRSLSDRDIVDSVQQDTELDTDEEDEEAVLEQVAERGENTDAEAVEAGGQLHDDDTVRDDIAGHPSSDISSPNSGSDLDI